jgi:hypothetical protein
LLQGAEVVDNVRPAAEANGSSDLVIARRIAIVLHKGPQKVQDIVLTMPSAPAHPLLIAVLLGIEHMF